jgi:hypothetical protein
LNVDRVQPHPDILEGEKASPGVRIKPVPGQLSNHAEALELGGAHFPKIASLNKVYTVTLGVVDQLFGKGVSMQFKLPVLWFKWYRLHYFRR